MSDSVIVLTCSVVPSGNVPCGTSRWVVPTTIRPPSASNMAEILPSALVFWKRGSGAVVVTPAGLVISTCSLSLSVALMVTVNPPSESTITGVRSPVTRLTM